MDPSDELMLPGFRFHPTDEELVGFYLRRKVQHKSLAVEVITQLDIYKFDPWDLPKMATVGEKEWYFFCPRDRKYRNSSRPNRVTGAGFWKATGTDRPIYSAEGVHCIGLKKSLVFYKGRSAKGIKTDWMMHEFRLPQSSSNSAAEKSQCPQPEAESWAVCRIFKKNPLMQRSMPPSWIIAPAKQPQTITKHLYGQFSATNSAESTDITLDLEQDSQAGKSKTHNYGFSSVNDEASYSISTDETCSNTMQARLESSQYFKDFNSFSDAEPVESSHSPCHSLADGDGDGDGDGFEALQTNAWDISLLFNLSSSPSD